MNSATKGLAFEYGPNGIRVNAILPTMTVTQGVEQAMGDLVTSRKTFASGLPLRRIGDVQDVASAAVFLANEESSFITGVGLEVDGGRHISASLFSFPHHLCVTQS